jgi:hypothetical protein
MTTHIFVIKKSSSFNFIPVRHLLLFYDLVLHTQFVFKSDMELKTNENYEAKEI